MCGYFGNVHECPAVIELMHQLNLPPAYKISERAYQRRRYSGLVTTNGYSEAMWWYALRTEEGKLVINEKLTSFNARDLSKPLWREPLKTKRALVLCSEIGESNGKDKYLMRSEEGFALGCLYKDWVAPDGSRLRSFAVITREPHDRFKKYHEKSTPFFLPLDKDVLAEWLNPTIGNSELINDLLATPRLYNDIKVTKVKSYKDAKPMSDVDILKKD